MDTQCSDLCHAAVGIVLLRLTGRYGSWLIGQGGTDAHGEKITKKRRESKKPEQWFGAQHEASRLREGRVIF